MLRGFGLTSKRASTNSGICLTSPQRMKAAGRRSSLVCFLRGHANRSACAKSLLASLKRTGEIQFQGEDYTINDEFKESTLQLADGLDLDEVVSARLLLGSQQDADVLHQPSVASALVCFHEKRQFLLESLRLILKQSIDPDVEEEYREVLRQFVSLVLETKDGPARNGSLYAQKCLAGMVSIENWLQALGDRYQGSLTIGQAMGPEKEELLQFQQASLGHQHESLGAVLTHLVKASHTAVGDFHKVLEHLPKLFKWNSLALHYIPLIIALISQHGSPDGTSTFRDARVLHQKIVNSTDSAAWPLRNLQAATVTWWLAEYSGWFLEAPTGSPMQGMNIEAEADGRSKAFLQALKDGAFQCTLSVCSQLKPGDWYDPVRNGLTRYLLKDAPALPREVMYASAYFQELVMEHVEAFIDAFVTNMPDTLRRFKAEEDDQRRIILATLQTDGSNGTADQEFHLERFLVIISYAFDDRPDAADLFWADTDSNLYGFLQWASKRQSTPRAGAFCELLRAISKGEECAASAHRFLLEEGGSVSSSRIRRPSSLSWTLIFEELSLYTSAVRDGSGVQRPLSSFSSRLNSDVSSKLNSDEIDEPESGLMLECYLRLTAHLCVESISARNWILYHPTFRILDSLFSLSSNTIPSRIQACAFGVVRALLTEKSSELGQFVWSSLDQWVSGGLVPLTNASRPAKLSMSPAQSETATFEVIAADFEASCEFINLLHNLVAPSANDSALNDSLPFPEQLGSAYRTPGIEPYIDFAFGRIFALSEQHLEDPLHLRILRCSVLDFATTCLGTFNENLVILANKSTIAVDSAMNTTSLAAYVRLHPFGRVMEWMFNEKVLAALFATARQDANEVSNSASDSPLLVSLLRCIDVMNLIMDLQSTYLEIARPQIKLHAVGHRKAVLNPALASFEDSVATNLDLIANLGLYAGAGNHALTVSSLKLLEKLSSSRRLNHQAAPSIGKRINGNRLIEVLEQQDQSDQIARSLVIAMQFDWRELNEGSEAPGWIIKSVVLDFLYVCLTSLPGRPTLAHALLGFACSSLSVDIPPNGLFAKGVSLFHAIMNLVVEYPDGDGSDMFPWASSLKQKGMKVLSELWTSPLTAIFTLTELRSSDFLFALFLKQQPVGPNTDWGGRPPQDPEFFYTESSLACADYLGQRRALFEYASAEIRLIADEAAPSLKARMFSTLLGSTTLPDGTQEPNKSIFDLFDFAELDFGDIAHQPHLAYFADVNFAVGAEGEADSDVVQFDLKIVEELMALRLNELRISGHLLDSNEEQQALAEASDALMFFKGRNQSRMFRSAKLHLLKAWSDVVKLFVAKCDFGKSDKSALILQLLQMVNPKLERNSEEDPSGALEVAKLIQALLTHLDFELLTTDSAKADDIGNDKLFQTFKTAMRAIHVPHGSSEFRESLYNICHKYLAGTSSVPGTSVRRRHETHIVKSAGGTLMDILCDDAYGGSSTCRISALLFLDSLVALAKAANSTYIVESLVRTNFIVLFVETISDIPKELRATERKGQ